MAELAPNVAGVPGTVGGVAATDVSLGPVDLFYGKVGRTIFVTDDPGATLTPQATALAPEGLPRRDAAPGRISMSREGCRRSRASRHSPEHAFRLHSSGN